MITIATIGAIVLIWPQKPINFSVEKLQINDKDIQVHVARSPEEWRQGLSGLSGLGENEGMFFIFNKSNFYYMWMKDMKFPIDIIWIGDDLKILDYKANVSPASYPETFVSKQPARYVLEINAGWIKNNNIEIGAKIVYNGN